MNQSDVIIVSGGVLLNILRRLKNNYMDEGSTPPPRNGGGYGSKLRRNGFKSPQNRSLESFISNIVHTTGAHRKMRARRLK